MRSYIRFSRITSLAAAGLMLLIVESAVAREVSVPLRFDNALVQTLQIDHVFTGAGGTLEELLTGL